MELARYIFWKYRVIVINYSRIIDLFCHVKGIRRRSSILLLSLHLASAFNLYFTTNNSLQNHFL